MLDYIEIKPNEFSVVQKLIFKECGISLNDTKKTLVESRLFKRLEHYKLKSYADYLKIVQLSATEKTEFINRLSTNETYFFREDVHFNFLKDIAKQKSHMRVWSAAASMGAEAYSIAFILDTLLPKNSWHVLGTDINTDVLEIARKGLYPLSWSEKIPQPYKSKYCLKGKDKFDDKMLIDRVLSPHIEFLNHNLLEYNSLFGEFDVIFLRNVLLYFKEETKLLVIKNLLQNLKEGGYLIISLTENFESEKINKLQQVQHSIFQKV